MPLNKLFKNDQKLCHYVQCFYCIRSSNHVKVVSGHI